MTVSPEQLHELLTYCIDFGRQMLDDSADFYPFGAMLDVDGRIVSVGGSDGEEKPAPQEIYRLLWEAFAAGAADGTVTAAALAANVDIPAEYDPPVPDGIRVHLESTEFSRFIYIPYAIGTKDVVSPSRTVTLFEPIAVQIEPGIFAAAPKG